jgi:dipeptidyl aminopeptidase/acylaminoacyl peptidase
MKKLLTILPGLIVLLFTSSGCKKELQVEKTLKSENILNVSYGTHIYNTFDIYLPEERTNNTPVIILIHGGAWNEGDKSLFTDLTKYWRDRGYAAATINYRLTHTSENNIHPAQVNDIGKAIEFISSKASEWHLSNNKFALLGASAGAHLSLLYTYKYNTNNKVKTVISMAGPSDLTSMENASAEQVQAVIWLLGSTFLSAPLLYSQASPVAQVNANSKPTLIFHGKLDNVVPYQQSVELQNRLNKSGIDNKLVLYDDTGHEVLNLANTAAFLATCDSWLKLYLK